MRNFIYQLSEENYQVINEVRATLNMMASMGLSDSNDSCNDISKDDLISVLLQAECRLKQVLQNTTHK